VIELFFIKLKYYHPLLECQSLNSKLCREKELLSKVKLRNDLIVTTLLLILIFSISSNISSVQAEAGGTGKYLEVKFTTPNNAFDEALNSSDCKVLATKYGSEETFTYEADVPDSWSQKVGAGTVLLDAIADTSGGWFFKCFVIRGEEKPDLTDYKTEKYDVVEALFDRLSYTVDASVVQGVGTISADGVDITVAGAASVYVGEYVTFDLEPNEGYYLSDVSTDLPIFDTYVLESVTTYVLGPVNSDGHWIEVSFEFFTYNIELSIVGGRGQIKFNGDIYADTEDNDIGVVGVVTVDWGSSPIFEFTPYVGAEDSYHLSTVLVNGTTYVDLVLTDFTTNYQFDEVKTDGQSLAVSFSVDGRADIPSGEEVTVFLSEEASLTFNQVSSGYAVGNSLPTIGAGDVVVWEITTFQDQATLGQQVIVALAYDPGDLTEAEEAALRMYRCDVDYEIWLRCDFNNDGVIDGQDVKVISSIVKHSKFLPENWEFYDLDGNNAIDEGDIHVVNSMKNIEWVDITLGVDTVNHIIYGLTDQFSIFRGR
jgi:hypothetical protein